MRFLDTMIGQLFAKIKTWFNIDWHKDLLEWKLEVGRSRWSDTPVILAWILFVIIATLLFA